MKHIPWRLLSLFLLACTLAGCGGCQPGAVPESEDASVERKAAPSAATPTRGSAMIPTARELPTMGVERPDAGAEEPPPPAPPAAAQDEPAEEEPEEADCSVIGEADPDYGEPPLTVNFTVDYECTEGSATVTWDFGDGSSGGGNQDNPTHTYTDAGEYVAVVTVTTADGATATDELDITVESEEEPPPDVEPGNP